MWFLPCYRLAGASPLFLYMGISSQLLKSQAATNLVPTILLGLLCPWMWGISSQLPPCHAASQWFIASGNKMPFFLFSLFFLRHVGSWFPGQEWNRCPLQWKCGVLTTGPPGKTQGCQFEYYYQGKYSLKYWQSESQTWKFNRLNFSGQSNNL